MNVIMTSSALPNSWHIIVYEEHWTALNRLNFTSVSNPAISERTAMKVMIVVIDKGNNYGCDTDLEVSIDVIEHLVNQEH